MQVEWNETNRVARIVSLRVWVLLLSASLLFTILPFIPVPLRVILPLFLLFIWEWVWVGLWLVKLLAE